MNQAELMDSYVWKATKQAVDAHRDGLISTEQLIQLLEVILAKTS